MKRSGFAVCLAGAVLLATGGIIAPEAQAQGLKLVGYGDLEWSVVETNDPTDQYHNFFDNHHFNLIGVAWVADDIVAAAEVEYEHAGEEIVFEYGYIAYTGLNNIRLAGGKFLIPFNRWNKDLHPTFISKMPGRPPSNAVVFPATYGDVGVWVSGAAPIGRAGARLTYDGYVVNGLKGDPDESNFRDLRDNDRDGPRDDNKAVGGRLGVELPKGVDFGVSGYTGDYATDLAISFVGADVSVHVQDVWVRGEITHASQDLTNGATESRTGGYGQVSYGLGDFEPVLRYSWVERDGEEFDVQELGIGINYYVSASSSVRLGYFFESESAGFETDNDKLVWQFNVLF